MRPEDFYAKTRASRGVRVELVDPAGNREWVRIRSVLSSEFSDAVTRSWGQLLADGLLGDESAAEQKRLRRRRHAMQTASLIAEWSLPPEIDAADLLVQNPRLRRQIERIAENHAFHFGVDR